MSRISVIVPVYNVEDYLDGCLESLAAQTFEDFEAICVNDGSPDGSRAILERWAQRDARFKIVDKVNGGLSSARNAGIDAASSDIVCFLDSDDTFDAHACERIVEVFDATDADVVTFGARCVPDSAATDWMHWVLSPRDVEYDEFSFDIISKEASRPFAWRTACRKSFLVDNTIRFDEGLRFGEDQVFDFEIYPQSRKTVFISDKLYDYRLDRPGSLMDRFAKNLDLKMAEHVKITDHVLAVWDRLGLLERYSSEMLAFVAEFVLYDTAKLPDAQFGQLAADLKQMLAKYWTREAAALSSLGRYSKRLVLDCFYDRSLDERARKKLVFKYYGEHFGKKAMLKRSLEIIKNKL